MGERYLIDTNAAIDYLGGKIPEGGMKFMDQIIDNKPNISIITKIELLRFNPLPDIYTLLNAFVGDCIILGLEESVVEVTITLCKTNRIKIPDAIIASTAIVNDYTLITRNTDDFKKIKELKLVDAWMI